MNFMQCTHPTTQKRFKSWPYKIIRGPHKQGFKRVEQCIVCGCEVKRGESKHG